MIVLVIVCFNQQLVSDLFTRTDHVNFHYIELIIYIYCIQKQVIFHHLTTSPRTSSSSHYVYRGVSIFVLFKVINVTCIFIIGFSFNILKVLNHCLYLVRSTYIFRCVVIYAYNMPAFHHRPMVFCLLVGVDNQNHLKQCRI